MGRYTGPKNKLSRREGKDLFGTGGESLRRRLNQPPGVHGRDPMQRRRPTEYSRQLREKQKVKRMYGMREQQFRRFYRMAERKPGLTGVELLKLLERRLDNVVYRMGWARTRPQARQMVNHGHVLIDGQRVDVPSFLVHPGQAIALKSRAQQMPDVQDLLASRVSVPGWLESDEGSGQILREPAREEIDEDIDEQLIVGFYSR